MAAPGNYKAILTRTHVDMMYMEWSADPRTNFDWAAYVCKTHRKSVDVGREAARLMQELSRKRQ